MAEIGKQFERLLELVARLRAENGCPWDREQSPATIKNYVLEEAYELVDAVEHHSPSHVAEELGDLIFMTVFLAHLYSEQDSFNLDQLLGQVAEKMIRRHPHVFGDHRVKSAKQVKQNWEEIKREERLDKTLGSALNGVPLALPALMRAHRILSRLVRTLHRPLNKDILLGELQQTLGVFLKQCQDDDGRSSSAILGKLLLLLVGLSQQADTRAEEDLRKTLRSFCRQVERLEITLASEGRSWEKLTRAEERSLWENL
jgi:MazG family protein